MDLRRQLQIVRHWLWLVIACLLIAAGTAYIVSSSLPKSYQGRVTLIVGQSLTSVNPDPNALLASQRLSQTYLSVLTTCPILDKVIDSLGLDMTADTLKSHISASAPANNTLIYITAEDASPERSAAIANAIANELIAASPAIEGKQGQVQAFVDAQLNAVTTQIQATQTEVDQLTGLATRTPEQEQTLTTDEARLVSLRAAYASLFQFSSNSAANVLTVVEPAIVPTEPSGPRVLLNTILAAILGLLIALGIAFLVEYLDDTVKSPEDVHEVAGVPTLGAIVRMKPVKGKNYALTTVEFPRAPATGAFRTLRTNLDFASLDEPLKTILITSALLGEGKTTVASNLAVVFAQAGKRVILLDADLRRPGVHRAFDLPNSYGLTNLLRAENLPLDSVVHQGPETNLRIITTGALPPNPAELLGPHRMKELLERLRKASDIVVVDSPPLQVVTDSAVLASEVDGTLLVIDSGRTRRGSVKQARESLERVGAKVLGAAVNRLSDRAGSYYYYQYYGNYGRSSGTTKSESATGTVR